MRNDQRENNLEIRNKLTLPFNSSTVLENTIDNVLSLNVDECIVVLGHYKDEIMEAISNDYDDKVKFVVNDPVDVGLSVSLLNGLQNTESEYVLCVTGDQPTVSSETLENIIQTLLNAEDPDNTVSILRRRKTGLLDTAKGLGMPFAMNRKNLISYLENENDNLNPILRKIFSDGFEFWGIEERDELELLNINHHKDYEYLMNIKLTNTSKSQENLEEVRFIRYDDEFAKNISGELLDELITFEGAIPDGISNVLYDNNPIYSEKRDRYIDDHMYIAQLMYTARAKEKEFEYHIDQIHYRNEVIFKFIDDHPKLKPLIDHIEIHFCDDEGNSEIIKKVPFEEYLDQYR